MTLLPLSPFAAALAHLVALTSLLTALAKRHFAKSFAGTHFSRCCAFFSSTPRSGAAARKTFHMERIGSARFQVEASHNDATRVWRNCFPVKTITENREGGGGAAPPGQRNDRLGRLSADSLWEEYGRGRTLRTAAWVMGQFENSGRKLQLRHELCFPFQYSPRGNCAAQRISRAEVQLAFSWNVGAKAPTLKSQIQAGPTTAAYNRLTPPPGTRKILAVQRFAVPLHLLPCRRFPGVGTNQGRLVV